MNNLYVQHSGVARFWAVITMCAVVLSAFSAPFSVAFAEEATEAEVVAEVVEPVTEEVTEPTPEPTTEETTEVVEEVVVAEVVEPVTEEVTEPTPEPTTEETTEVVEDEVFEEAAPQAFARVALVEEVVAPTCQNLFENGSFEDPEVTDGSLWQKFASVAGWLIERVSDESPTTLEAHRGWSGNVSADGLQYVELDGDHSTQVSQTVSTVIGAEYELTWAFAPRHNIAADQNKLDVLVNGGLVGSNGPEAGAAPLALDDWTYTTVNFVATTTETEFTFRDAGASNSFGTFLDDTQLCLVDMPEPETETITVCKYADNEQSISGWEMTITNNQVDNKLVSYTVETGEDGCVSQEVDPLKGPFFVTEEDREGWNQVDVWADYGLVEEGEGYEYCSFFNLQEAKVAAFDSEVEFPTYRCSFMNEEVEVPVCEVGVNLVQNGSFETPNLPADGFGWDIFESVSNGLVWVVDWLNPTEGSPTPAELELQSGYYTASNGVQYAELDSNWNPAPGGPYFGEDTRVSIHQDIVTIPGNTYTVSYDFSALPRRGADTNILQVLLDEIEVAEHTADGIGQTDTVWTTYTYSFVATSTTARVGFADAGLADSFGTLLDNVSVVCSPTIPEEEEEEPTPTRRNGSGGTLVRPTPTVAGDSISAPTPEPMVLGEQVTAVPYGAPGAGQGGSAQQNTLSLGNILFLATRRTNVK